MEVVSTSLLIGVGLAMDCLAVSFAAGAHQRTSRIKAAAILALFFGGFQCGMTLLGWVLGTGFAEIVNTYDNLVAAALLFIIGGKMTYEGFSDRKEESPDIFNILAIITLSIATSIDALAVGIGFAFLEIIPLIPSFIIGIISAVFSVAGIYTGGKVGHLLGKKVDILGGFILILIGLKVFFQL
ncbi:MAG: manganese efflux pump [Methanomicrobiales archaeon]|nr:manganese efflux pump [Methanomicrobiales archaeon]